MKHCQYPFFHLHALISYQNLLCITDRKSEALHPEKPSRLQKRHRQADDYGWEGGLFGIRKEHFWQRLEGSIGSAPRMSSWKRAFSSF